MTIFVSKVAVFTYLYLKAHWKNSCIIFFDAFSPVIGPPSLRAAGFIWYLSGLLDQGLRNGLWHVPRTIRGPDGGGRQPDLHPRHPCPIGGHMVPQPPGLQRMCHRGFRESGKKKFWKREKQADKRRHDACACIVYLSQAPSTHAYVCSSST